jgi:hypothetical protein
MVGFHLMKVSSWNQMVAPPKMTITPRLIQSIGSTRRPRPSSQPTCANVARIAVAVARRIGARSDGTRPSPMTPPSVADASA